MIHWIDLHTEEQLTLIKDLSINKPQLIFKHSTRCSTSILAKSRLEKEPHPSGLDCYYLDLLQYRHISNKIAEEFSVHHESPQVLLIQHGECVYDESHLGIRMDEILSSIA